MITGRVAFEDAQFQLDMTDIEFFDLSKRDLKTNKVSHFDCKCFFYNNFKVENDTVYWLGYAGNKNIKMLDPEWIENGTIRKDYDLLFPITWR